MFECELDVDEVRRQLGGKGVIHRKGIIAIDGPVPIEMMHSLSLADFATVPAEIAAWANSLLGLPPEAAVQPKHPGVIRLSRWINARLASGGGGRLVSSELVDRAGRWLPEFFKTATLGPKRLGAHRRVGLTEYDVDEPQRGPDPREVEALQGLDNPRPEERVRGLALLGEMGAADLFDWCVMFLDDEAQPVRIAALHTMLQCDSIIPEAIETLADSQDRSTRAAAIAVLAKHSDDGSAGWIKRGLADPQVCVRVEAVRFLNRLDRRRHRRIIELASHDPNPDIAARARKCLSGGKH
ncbi:MAG TPA: hypothetical protein VMZ31_16775 [Phycisphaerae bacterium]|nr:hypothetical protein [Phycisphaerae bacterium]